MIYKLLMNINNFFSYVIAFFIICLLIYLVYKIFILENDIYILNDKINKIEIEYGGGGNINTEPLKIRPFDKYMEEINVNEIIMNNIFGDSCMEQQVDQTPNISNLDIIDIDKEEIQDDVVIEPIFDLKKEVIMDDKESVLSTNNLPKKKLLKLNLDRLKEKCAELSLPTEGTKAQLIERILEKETQQ